MVDKNTPGVWSEIPGTRVKLLPDADGVLQVTSVPAELPVVLDWHMKPGATFIFENTLYKSPQDATPHELATCRRQNEKGNK